MEERTRRSEYDTVLPKLLSLKVIVDPIADTIALADIDRRQVVFLHESPKKINAWTLESRLVNRICLEGRPALSWENRPKSGPTQLVDDPQSFRISVGHKDANRVRVGHHYINFGNLHIDKRQSQFRSVAFTCSKVRRVFIILGARLKRRWTGAGTTTIRRAGRQSRRRRGATRGSGRLSAQPWWRRR